VSARHIIEREGNIMNQSTIDQCAEVARSFGVKKLILFGSALRSPDAAQDLDFACEGLGGWDLFRFGAKLGEALHKRVDVVPLRVDDRFSQYVAQRGRILYEAG
jgi:predicted nucleotidyltransferase